MFDDRDYPYAVNPQFKAWVPLTRNPGSWLVYTPGSQPRLVYLQPFDYWHVVPQAPDGYWVEHFDIVVIRTPEEALQHLPKASARCAILGEAQGALGDYAPNNPQAVIDYLEYHRAFKTPYEVAMMREATRRGVRGHRAAERAFRAGASEFGIHLAYCQAAGQDAGELPYGNIVALNEHGAVLHYTELGRLPPKPVRSFLIDAGGSHGGYACDITRTYSADTGRRVPGIDRRGRCRAAGDVRAGARRLRLQAAAPGRASRAGRHPRRTSASSRCRRRPRWKPASVPRSSRMASAMASACRCTTSPVSPPPMPAARSPSPKAIPYLRLTRVLEPGMVVTIEPGIYFIDMLLEKLKQDGHADSVDWARVDAFRPYGGIRIEDDVVCTDAAPLNLTRDGFAEVA